MSAPKKAPQEFVEPKNFEDALTRLQTLVEALEVGDVPLEASLSAYAEGQKLIGYCQKKLSSAEKTIKDLTATLNDASANSESDSE